MAVASVYGLPHIVPTFGGMLVLVKHAAKTTIEILQPMEYLG